MVSYTPSASKVKDVKQYGWAVYESPDLPLLDTNDTVTCPEFTDDIALDHALLIDNSTRAELTCTIALNVVTVTQAATTDAHCTLYVYGQREA